MKKLTTTLLVALVLLSATPSAFALETPPTMPRASSGS